MNASFGNTLTDSGGAEFGVTGGGGSFSSAALDGTTRATIGQGTVTVRDQSEDETAAQLSETNRDINNATTITRDTSFDTGNIFIDVGAARRAKGNIENIRELRKEFADDNIAQKTIRNIRDIEQSLTNLAIDSLRENIPDELQYLLTGRDNLNFQDLSLEDREAIAPYILETSNQRLEFYQTAFDNLQSRLDDFEGLVAKEQLAREQNRLLEAITAELAFSRGFALGHDVRLLNDGSVLYLQPDGSGTTNGRNVLYRSADGEINSGTYQNGTAHIGGFNSLVSNSLAGDPQKDLGRLGQAQAVGAQHAAVNTGEFFAEVLAWGVEGINIFDGDIIPGFESRVDLEFLKLETDPETAFFSEQAEDVATAAEAVLGGVGLVKGAKALIDNPQVLKGLGNLLKRPRLNTGNNEGLINRFIKDESGSVKNPFTRQNAFGDIKFSGPARRPVDDPELNRILDSNFGKFTPDGTRVGNGGTADALRFENATGELLSPKGHRQDALALRKRLRKFVRKSINSPNPDRDGVIRTKRDIDFANELIKDLDDALGD